MLSQDCLWDTVCLLDANGVKTKCLSKWPIWQYSICKSDLSPKSQNVFVAEAVMNCEVVGCLAAVPLFTSKLKLFPFLVTFPIYISFSGQIQFVQNTEG